MRMVKYQTLGLLWTVVLIFSAIKAEENAEKIVSLCRNKHNRHLHDEFDDYKEAMCEEFNWTYDQVAELLSDQYCPIERLQRLAASCPYEENKFGLGNSEKNNSGIAKVLTLVAQIYQTEKGVCLDDFNRIADKCLDATNKRKVLSKVQTKYRMIDGRGNNRKHPEWGAVDTPFSRFVSKNYEDGIYRVKKSVVDGSDLPNPREIVKKVLTAAVPTVSTKPAFNVLAILLVLFITHDIHYQVPKRQCGSDTEIQCCTRNLKQKLPENLLSPDCLPIDIPADDDFYKSGNIQCMNMVRSQLGKYSDGVETGEILNRATSYLDLSMVYGNRESELVPVRLWRHGKLRMDDTNTLPVDENGDYIPIMDRFISTPIATIWPILFARNHNLLASVLEKINHHWDDETLFQEARRINIAIFQYNLIGTDTIKTVFGGEVKAVYSEQRNAATSVEFSQTYRGAHYYMLDNLEFIDSTGTVTAAIPQSDTIGKFETTVRQNFDEALRAVLRKSVNTGPYSEEMYNKINKNKDGFGMDLISIDIQRGRDQGVPSYLETRKHCNMTPVLTTFDDFAQVMDEPNVDLLKEVYASPEDVDLYVAGWLEVFKSTGNPLAGPTFACAISENFKNTVGGDIYFYSHPENPYPFTTAQLTVISGFSMRHIICLNSGLSAVNKGWGYNINAPGNSEVPCTLFKVPDLSAWKDDDHYDHD